MHFLTPEGNASARAPGPAGRDVPSLSNRLQYLKYLNFSELTTTTTTKNVCINRRIQKISFYLDKAGFIIHYLD